MNLAEALEILEEHGANQDPIRCKGVETDPDNLERWHNVLDDAKDITISYFGANKNPKTRKRIPVVWIVRGTLSAMVKDRMEMK